MKKVILSVLALSLVVVPAALADKPASKPKPKPVASEKTWIKVGGGKSFGTLVTLNALGVTVTPLKPAATASAAVRFPITQGKLILTTDANKAVIGVRGSVGHVGGLKLVNGDKAVLIRNLVLVANLVSASPDQSKLTAQIAGRRVDLATVTLGTVTVAAGKVTVPVTAMVLTADAATALNTALGTTLAGGSALGMATTTARLVGKGKAA